MPKQESDVGQFKTHFMGRLFHFKHSVPKIPDILQFVMLISLISIIAFIGKKKKNLLETDIVFFSSGVCWFSVNNLYTPFCGFVNHSTTDCNTDFFFSS